MALMSAASSTALAAPWRTTASIAIPTPSVVTIRLGRSARSNAFSVLPLTRAGHIDECHLWVQPGEGGCCRQCHLVGDASVRLFRHPCRGYAEAERAGVKRLKLRLDGAAVQQVRIHQLRQLWMPYRSRLPTWRIPVARSGRDCSSIPACRARCRPRSRCELRTSP